MSELDPSTQYFLLPPKTSLKKTLILDLDETLVHSQFPPFTIKSDVIIKIDIENQLHDIHVLIRPGVPTFLQRLSKLYEIVIFTASVSKYADPLLDILDKDNLCSYRLFREHCTMVGTTYIKDLNKLGRDLKDVIIVDNSPQSYSNHKENGIPILTWFNDKNDTELYKLLPILEFLSGVNDVRDYIKDIVINDTISYENVINIINKYSEIYNEPRSKNYINEIIRNINLSNERVNKDHHEVNNNINNINNKEDRNRYINITIANNEINNYLYFSPIYTINNIKNTNENNDSIDNLDIKINNEYDKTKNLQNNQKVIKNKKVVTNLKINKHKSKDAFNKINKKVKTNIKNNNIKMKKIKIIMKNNIQKKIKINNITNKSINYAFNSNSKNLKDSALDPNIIDLKTLISTKKSNSRKNYKLPKTPEIEQILYNTNNNNTKNINSDIINRFIYQTGHGNSIEANKINLDKEHYGNSTNKLKHKIDLNINHEKYKSFYYTDNNSDSNFITLKNNNTFKNNLLYDINLNVLPKNSSHSKNKLTNAIKANKTLNNQNIKNKYSLNNFHKKTLSSQFKIIGISQIDKSNKITKIKNYNLQIQNSNSKRNNRIRKINTINRTIYDNNSSKYSLKKYYNMNTNTSKRSIQLNIQKKLFKPIFTNKIKKFVTNIKDITDYNNTLRHKKTLSCNGDIFPLYILNRTSSSSISKRIIRDKSNNLSNINNISNGNKSKNSLKKIKININNFKNNKFTTIRKIKDIKFINAFEKPKNKANNTAVNNIILNKLIDNGNKIKKSLRINSGNNKIK